MKALVSPNEVVFGESGDVLGVRVAEVEPSEFDVASPLFWVDCPDDCVADAWYYNQDTQELKPIPMPEPPPVEIPVTTV